MRTFNTNEEETIAAIVKFLGVSGYRAWRQNNAGRFDTVYCLQELLKLREFTRQSISAVFTRSWRKVPNAIKGVADIIGFNRKSGLWIAVEVKIGSDQLRPEQINWLTELHEAGGIVIVAHDFDEFHRKFKDKHKSK
jgi:hypothetical protein